MGSFLLAAGEPGMRIALPNARIMVHQPSGGARGMASDIEIQAKEILRIRARMNDLYVKYTGQSLTERSRRRSTATPSSKPTRRSSSASSTRCSRPVRQRESATATRLGRRAGVICALTPVGSRAVAFWQPCRFSCAQGGNYIGFD